jgi:hypothetical protein
MFAEGKEELGEGRGEGRYIAFTDTASTVCDIVKPPAQDDGYEADFRG